MSTNEENKDRYSEGVKSFGKPFEIELVEEAILENGDTDDDTPAPDGYINKWNPIPRLRRLLDRLIPPRRSD